MDKTQSVIRRFLVFAFICGCATHSAWAADSIALFGTPKYAHGFTHFDYVNPHAPKGGTLKLAYNANFDSTNPYILKGIAAPGISNFLYQSLMTGSYDEPQSYYPLIADSITVSADKKRIAFTLNPNARWHDGSPITAEDVVFSFTALKEKGHPSYRLLYKPITVQKTGTRSVAFTVEGTPQREQPLLVASLPVLPKKYFCDLSLRGGEADAAIQQKESESGSPRFARDDEACIPFEKTTLRPPLGSGPYKIASIDAGKTIVFERVSDYWAANLPTQKGLNNFDKIQFDVYRDDVVSVEGIKSHQFDFYEEFIARNWATSYDSVPAVKSGQLIKTLLPHKIPRGMQGFLFNTRLPKFADRRVREAIGLTMDFEWMNAKLFYGAYTRNGSYFNNTEFAAPELPDAAERTLLNKLGLSRLTTHDSRLTPPPTTDGSGYARANLIRAQTLLNEAGWVMKNGQRVNAKTGEPLTIEFLMTQRTFERVIGIMRHNLNKLGIASSFRYVDASQYQKRVDQRQFDIISIWWNQGTFYPGNEQVTYWHSSQADVTGSQNLAGVKNPAVDKLVEKIAGATTLNELRPAARALDRVLLNEHYVIPHWNLSAWRILYWNQFGRPDVTPAYNYAIDSWWQAAPAAKSSLRGGEADAAIQTKRESRAADAAHWIATPSARDDAAGGL